MPVVYGPVPSRRLGRSLGVDIIPFKTCTYNCVYCQLGKTTVHTLERREYVPTAAVLDGIRAKLDSRPDIISFAGSGEPTLNSSLGAMIRGIKKMTDIPVAVFTNASLLWMPEVRADLELADIVSPSLDAALPASAERVNKLCPGLTLDRILDGLVEFCHTSRSRIWMEVLLCEGLNDSNADIEAVASVLRRTGPVERVQLNSVSRPPAEAIAHLEPRARLEDIARRLPGTVEIIASYPKASAQTPEHTATAEDLADLITCHPCPIDAAAAGLAIPVSRAQELADTLLAAGRLRTENRPEGIFYFATDQER